MKLDLTRAAFAAALAIGSFTLAANPASAGATTGHWKNQGKVHKHDYDSGSYGKYRKYEKYGYSRACHYDRQCRDRFWREHGHHHHASRPKNGVTVKVH